jgi:DNA-binding NarL/FixJ family response regulator
MQPDEGSLMDLDDLFSDSVDDKIDVERAIGGLSLREKQIVYLFACGHTQGEIAEAVGLCQQRISQILANISKKR